MCRLFVQNNDDGPIFHEFLSEIAVLVTSKQHIFRRRAVDLDRNTAELDFLSAAEAEKEYRSVDLLTF